MIIGENKKQKILITGVLGYIATGFLNNISIENYEITGIDNRFIPDKVAWLVNKGIKYYNRDLFNIKDLLKNVDFVIHTAGITAVPTVKSKSTPEIDKEIFKVGREGTLYIIENCNESCKIIFLSTHVIFESLKESILVTEKNEPCPNLAYSSSKYQSELDLFKSDKNFIILRLASVYGYNNSIRWKILPNLFSKKASQNEIIQVFGNGNNVKPLIGINDISRFIEFILKSNYNKEIFNVVKEHKTVREIAEICKFYKKDLKIEFTDDEIPNLGYKLCNKKILDTCFCFNNNIENEIKKMINIWENK